MLSTRTNKNAQCNSMDQGTDRAQGSGSCLESAFSKSRGFPVPSGEVLQGEGIHNMRTERKMCNSMDQRTRAQSRDIVTHCRHDETMVPNLVLMNF